VVGFYLSRYPISFASLNYILAALTDFGFFHAYMVRVLLGFSAAALLLILMARGGGLLIQQFLPERALTRPEHWVLGSALSVGLLSAIVLGAGAMHLWNAGVFIIVCISIGLWAISLPMTEIPSAAFRPSAWTVIWKILLALLVLLYVLGAAAPEIFFDSLHYHLAIPNLYRLEHRIFSVPTDLYADFVMNVQLIYGLAITVGNTLSAKAVHIGLSFLLGIGFVAFARRFFGTASGWLAALLFLSMPMVAINATTAGTDVAGAFLLFASAVTLVLALESPTARAFQMAGALTGIASGTKYPAFVFIPVACLLITWHFTRDEKKPWREWLPLVGQFTAGAILFVAPILIKNIVFHHNPLYPFGGTFLGHPRLDPLEWHKFISDTSPRDWGSAFSSPAAILHWLAAPWFVTFESQGTLGPVLLMGLPFLFRRSDRSLAYRLFQRYAALLWIIWVATSTVPRYGLPALVLTCPLIAEAVLSAVSGWLERWVLLGSFTLGIVANIALQLIILFSWEGWQVVAGQVSEADYLGRSHTLYPTPPYDGLIWMNENLPKDARVLFAGESRSYYLNRRSIPIAIPGSQPVVAWSREATSGQELAQRMRAEGVTHIFLNLMEALRTDSYQELRWDPASWAVFDDFWTHSTRLIWRKEIQDHTNPQALYVFELVPEAIAAQPHPPTPNPFIHWKPK
jgi:hypothetical protein